MRRVRPRYRTGGARRPTPPPQAEAIEQASKALCGWRLPRLRTFGPDCNSCGRLANNFANGPHALRRDRIQRVTNKTHPYSLASDLSRHFGYSGTTNNRSGIGRTDDALAGAFHEQEVPF